MKQAICAAQNSIGRRAWAALDNSDWLNCHSMPVERVAAVSARGCRPGMLVSTGFARGSFATHTDKYGPQHLIRSGKSAKPI